MRKAKESDRERLLQYLKENVQDCLYLYIDIMNYGIATDNMTVWLKEQDGQIVLVAMKYYDSYQIYSHKRDGELEELCCLLRENPVSMISGRKDIMERLAGNLPGYKASYGIVFRIYPRSESYESPYHLLCATIKDAVDIAKLLCSYEGFGEHYTVEGLAEQLTERIRTETGHSYIARNEQNEIIAHVGTFAEAEDIAVVSGAVVAPSYRKTDVYEHINKYMYDKMAQKNKNIYAFAIEKKMIYLQKMWGMDCGEYGKLVKEK